MKTNIVAFGAPGIEPRWTSSAKDGIGTAYNSSSLLWFTLSHGIVNEIYFPHVDSPNTRDLQFLITDGESFCHEEKRDLLHKTEYPEQNALFYRLTNSDPEGRYRLVKDIVVDPHSSVLLMHTRLDVLDPKLLGTPRSSRVWCVRRNSRAPEKTVRKSIFCSIIRASLSTVDLFLSPDVAIAIGALVKRPGEELIGDPAELKVVNHPRGDEMDAYERLLSDAMAGDGTLFAGQDGVEAAWAVVQPVLGSVVPVHAYEPGTWGPYEAEKFVSRPAEAGKDGARCSVSLAWA